MNEQQRKAMELALEALEECRRDPRLKYEHPAYDKTITAIKEALAQPEQEPVAWMDADGNISYNNDHKCFSIPLYTTPPQRTAAEGEDTRRAWVGLTDLENAEFVKTMERCNFLVAIYDIEKKLKEKNT